MPIPNIVQKSKVKKEEASGYQTLNSLGLNKSSSRDIVGVGFSYRGKRGFAFQYSIYYIYKYKTIEEGIDPEEDNAILQRKHVAASEEHQRLIQEALASRRVKSTENNFNIDAMGDMAEGDALFGSSDEIVKGYRFSILYPDLIDTEAPTYTTEKDGDSVETLIIRFHAGPPYEDIAFRILNNEWECSAKKGFKCTFERGILHLNINFKQHPYRRILG
ncbi:hypothetical protein POM88_053855 [Heracleum sosnowskyi]|uniref:Splicing factor Cactin C-terminal domain-containing protein n=1 Tax=Heracleum sosnowskyi TaxID=360622 RepID=A0AAD8GPI4_9APIA|nr:hypothetical protein POM88_053855 [Heracleum sosnowskyi]